MSLLVMGSVTPRTTWRFNRVTQRVHYTAVFKRLIFGPCMKSPKLWPSRRAMSRNRSSSSLPPRFLVCYSEVKVRVSQGIITVVSRPESPLDSQLSVILRSAAALLLETSSSEFQYFKPESNSQSQSLLLLVCDTVSERKFTRDRAPSRLLNHSYKVRYNYQLQLELASICGANSLTTTAYSHMRFSRAWNSLSESGTAGPGRAQLTANCVREGGQGKLEVARFRNPQQARRCQLAVSASRQQLAQPTVDPNAVCNRRAGLFSVHRPTPYSRVLTGSSVLDLGLDRTVDETVLTRSKYTISIFLAAATNSRPHLPPEAIAWLLDATSPSGQYRSVLFPSTREKHDAYMCLSPEQHRVASSGAPCGKSSSVKMRTSFFFPLCLFAHGGMHPGLYCVESRRAEHAGSVSTSYLRLKTYQDGHPNRIAQERDGTLRLHGLGMPVYIAAWPRIGWIARWGMYWGTWNVLPSSPLRAPLGLGLSSLLHLDHTDVAL
ncbi:hypothetical protein C8R47DRAFT_1238776 [Mycena vitilis]|nr:hypothetical protein C8R47DRAFT_1238776 [Mycena vitilis]